MFNWLTIQLSVCSGTLPTSVGPVSISTNIGYLELSDPTNRPLWTMYAKGRRSFLWSSSTAGGCSMQCLKIKDRFKPLQDGQTGESMQNSDMSRGVLHWPTCCHECHPSDENYEGQSHPRYGMLNLVRAGEERITSGMRYCGCVGHPPMRTPQTRQYLFPRITSPTPDQHHQHHLSRNFHAFDSTKRQPKNELGYGKGFTDVWICSNTCCDASNNDALCPEMLLVLVEIPGKCVTDNIDTHFHLSTIIFGTVAKNCEYDQHVRMRV